jgi:methionyl aminopeptidase
MIQQGTLSDRVILLLTEGGRLAAMAIQSAAAVAEAGTNLADIAAHFEQVASHLGVTPASKGYDGFPHSLGFGLNEYVGAMTMLESVTLAEGDLLTIDAPVAFEGYFFDVAVSVEVGSQMRHCKLLAGAKACLDAAILAAHPGARSGEIGEAVSAAAALAGVAVAQRFRGHGIGKALHEYPTIAQSRGLRPGPRLRQGRMYALEPVVTIEPVSFETSIDGWTARTLNGQACAFFEHTILLAPNGVLVLTAEATLP